MAIYKTGTASMDANGVITGKGTAWMTALSLIRVGATIVLLSGEKPVFATIATIISDTEMRASEKPEAAVADGTYTILLHDSLTVDGLAQDIAETLKYYQSTETQVSQVVDLLKEVDVNQLISLDRSMKETAQRVEDSEDTIKGYADEAELSSANAAQSVIDAAAQVDLAKGEVANAAAQVDLAKDEVENAKAQADLAAGSVADAAAEVQKAADQVALAQQAVTDAGAQVDLASGFADDAKAQADRAEQLANSVEPDQLLKKDQNLADVASKSASLQNLLEGKPLPLAAPAVNPNDAPTLQQVQNMSGGGTGPTQSGVMNFGIGSKRIHDSRNYIPPYEITADGQLLNRADWPDLWAYAQMVGVITDSVWRGDVGQRAKYSSGDGTATFRVPDLNGSQRSGVNGFVGPDSILGLYGRGDTGTGVAGLVQEGGVPNITGTFQTMNGAASGAFADQSTNSSRLATSTSGAASGVTSFDASKVSPLYKNIVEVRPNSFFGVWVIRASGAFVAANTSFGVMNSYAAGQPANSLLEGGRVQSEIRVGGAVSSKAALVAKRRVGGEAWAAIEITDASGAQQTVKTIAIPNIDGSTILTDKSVQSPVAWVSFNGADGSIFGSHNVSSVSKSSGGLYEINFIRNTQDTKYAVVASAYQAASQTSSTVVSETGSRAVNKTTVKVMRADSAVGVENAAIISVIVMGVLA